MVPENFVYKTNEDDEKQECHLEGKNSRKVQKKSEKEGKR